MTAGMGDVEVCFVHGDRAALGATLRPKNSLTPGYDLEGRGGALVAFDWARSIEAAPGARFDVSAMASGGLVVGIGWDAMRNKTFEKLYGNGAGPPDLDVAVYSNRWGREALDQGPPRADDARARRRDAARQPRGDVRLGDQDLGRLARRRRGRRRRARRVQPNERRRVRLLDPRLRRDRVGRARLQLREKPVLPPARRHARQHGDRALPLSRSTRVPAGRQDGGHGAIRARIAESAPTSQDACPPAAPIKSSWVLRTVGGYLLEADPAVPFMSPNDVVVGMHIGHAPVPLCNTVLSVNAVLQGGLFNANIDRIQDAIQHCAPVTIKFSSAGAGDKIEYEATFDTDPTAGMLTFKPQKLEWSSLSNLVGLSSAIGVPQVATVMPAYAPRRTTDRLLPFTGAATVTRPDRVLLHGFKAVIGAKDLGGITDAYCRLWYNTINTKAGLFVKENCEVEIARSQVLKKMPCPGLAAWPEFSVVVPIESMVGTIPALIVTVRDKD